MITFLPIDGSFLKSAKCLDFNRIRRQCEECKQIYAALIDKNSGWRTHPAVEMWMGHEAALLQYWLACTLQCSRKNLHIESSADGIRTISCASGNKFADMMSAYCRDEVLDPPPWFNAGCEVSKSHRAALLAKDMKFYGKYKWMEKPEINYYWPTRHRKELAIE